MKAIFLSLLVNGHIPLSDRSSRKPTLISSSIRLLGNWLRLSSRSFPGSILLSFVYMCDDRVGSHPPGVISYNLLCSSQMSVVHTQSSDEPESRTTTSITSSVSSRFCQYRHTEPHAERRWWEQTYSGNNRLPLEGNKSYPDSKEDDEKVLETSLKNIWWPAFEQHSQFL